MIGTKVVYIVHVFLYTISNRLRYVYRSATSMVVYTVLEKLNQSSGVYRCFTACMTCCEITIQIQPTRKEHVVDWPNAVIHLKMTS